MMRRRDALGLPLAAFQVKSAFYTAAEIALLDELTEMIIPADEHSPGAHAAGVAADLAIRKQSELWKDGLAHFARLAGDQRLPELLRLSEAKEGPMVQFFEELKHETAKSYWTSRIGIHDDLEYKGNVIQTGEYAGFDPE